MSCSRVSIALPLSRLPLPYDIVNIITNEVLSHNFAAWWNNNVQERTKECRNISSIVGKRKHNPRRQELLLEISNNYRCKSHRFGKWDNLGGIPYDNPYAPVHEAYWIQQWRHSRGI